MSFKIETQGIIQVSRKFGFEKLFAKIYAEWQNNVKLNKVPSRFSPSLGENDGKIISTWNLGIYFWLLFIMAGGTVGCSTAVEINTTILL